MGSHFTFVGRCVLENWNCVSSLSGGCEDAGVTSKVPLAQAVISFWNLLKDFSGCHLAPPRVLVASLFLLEGAMEILRASSVTQVLWGLRSSWGPELSLQPGVQSKATVRSQVQGWLVGPCLLYALPAPATPSLLPLPSAFLSSVVSALSQLSSSRA